MSNHVILDRIWGSDKLAACSIKAQLHYPRIYLVCDDWACFEIDVVAIHRQVYPKMPSVKESDVFGWLKEFMDNGLLFVWSEGHNEYGYWTGREEGRLHAPTRRHKRRTPEPPADALASYQLKYEQATRAYKLTTSSLQEPTSNVAIPKPGLKHGPGPSDAQTPFARFWEAYPKKKNKGQAERAWESLSRRGLSEQLMNAILSAIERAKTSADWQKDNGQFIPYPATWLNAKGWEDEIEESSQTNGSDTAQSLEAQAADCDKALGPLYACEVDKGGKGNHEFCAYCVRSNIPSHLS